MLIVDVYNVLHVTGVLPPELAGLDVLGLADLVAISRYGKGKTFLVCDGFGSPTADDAAAHAILKGREPRAADFQGILFAGRGRDADSLIETLLARFGGTRAITVVSSDRRLGRAARGLKSRWVRSDEFLVELVSDVQRGGGGFRPLRPAFASDLPLSPGETERWLREFGVEPTMQSPSAIAGAPENAKAAPEKSSLVSRPPKRGPAAAALPPISPNGPAAPAPEQGGENQSENPQRPSAVGIDPLLVQALRMWPGRISLDEFDMEAWLGDDGRDPSVDKYR